MRKHHIVQPRCSCTQGPRVCHAAARAGSRSLEVAIAALRGAGFLPTGEHEDMKTCSVRLGLAGSAGSPLFFPRAGECGKQSDAALRGQDLVEHALVCDGTGTCLNVCIFCMLGISQR